MVEELEKIGCSFVDYPLLIRLNPNVPWKTRGNGALCLRIEYEKNLELQIKDRVRQLVEKYSDLGWKGTDPGVVFLKIPEIPSELREFAARAEKELVAVDEALFLIRKFEAEYLSYNTQLGLVGALAAVGETLSGDYTYELIAYREPENIGKARQIVAKSIFKMDEILKPYTFNNVDYEKRRIVITPRGPDPILFGVRGESPQVVKEAFKMIKSLEEVERWMIFRSNQGTDAHLKRISKIREARPTTSVVVSGAISRRPEIVPIRHVVFQIQDETGEIDCIAYEPTGALRKIAQKLMLGDQVEVYGAVKKKNLGSNENLTLNLEKIDVLELAAITHLRNPKCPNCRKTLKSMGKNQGFRCEKCKTRFSKLEKSCFKEIRGLNEGLYVTSTRSQRHLTKPLRRYGQEKRGQTGNVLIEGWHSGF
jgi:tRNA(Ile2)-agmatinylcytidine synthase